MEFGRYEFIDGAIDRITLIWIYVYCKNKEWFWK